MEHPLDFLNPHDNETNNNCSYCGVDCEDTFCSKECKNADYLENCD